MAQTVLRIGRVEEQREIQITVEMTETVQNRTVELKLAVRVDRSNATIQCVLDFVDCLQNAAVFVYRSVLEVMIGDQIKNGCTIAHLVIVDRLKFRQVHVFAVLDEMILALAQNAISRQILIGRLLVDSKVEFVFVQFVQLLFDAHFEVELDRQTPQLEQVKLDLLLLFRFAFA